MRFGIIVKEVRGAVAELVIYRERIEWRWKLTGYLRGET